jgi:tetratricopeptide (TPR) repeat protein/tRNA A-37 threonylcarbamoyl transferase component Bud32
MTDCPSKEQLRQLACGSAICESFHQIETHIQDCETCQQFLEGLRTGSIDCDPEETMQPDLIPPLPGLELLESLGKGGTGVVFKARQLKLNRLVAVKVLLGGEYTDAGERARFRREANAIASLQHPNIIQILEVDEAGGRPFLVLEYAEGGSLAQRQAEIPLPPNAAAELVRIVASAVDYMHAQGVIHRDLKPGNVLLFGQAGAPVERQQAKISDFGLTKKLGSDTCTESGTVLGTPSYMAPEQATGMAVDARTDIYALGAILYFLLTGRPPFQGSSPLETIEQVRHQEPVSPRQLQPRAARDLETICLKCLQKEPARRYATAQALADDLHRFLDGRVITARAVSRLEHAWRWCRREPAVAALTAVLVVVLLGAIAGMGLSWRRTFAALQAAEDSARETSAALRAAEESARDTSAALRAAQASDLVAQEALDELLRSIPSTPIDVDLYNGVPRLEPLLRAENHRRRLLEKSPENIQLRMALSTLRERLASVYRLRGQVSEAVACLQEAQGLWAPLVQKDPGNREYRYWLAITTACLAGPQGYDIASDQWWESLWKANDIRQQLVLDDPTNERFASELLQHRCDIVLQATSEYLIQRPARPAMEQRHEALVRQVLVNPGDRLLRERLAFTCFLLGEMQNADHRQSAAVASWRAAHQHCKHLLEAPAHDVVTVLLCGFCCSRLMDGQSSDPYYREAVQLLEQAGDQLANLLETTPTSYDLWGTFKESRCALALCHWKVGDRAQAEKTFASLARHVKREAGERLIGELGAVRLLQANRYMAAKLRETGLPAPALALAREAENLVFRYYASVQVRSPDALGTLATEALYVAALLCQLGEPAESLLLAEESRQIYEDLCRRTPDVPLFLSQLSFAWERIGKAHSELKQEDAALVAFQEAVKAQRRAFEITPNVRQERIKLGRCYERLAHCLARQNDWAGVAAAHLEREKLWLADGEELEKIARGLGDLAREMGEAKKHLTPEEEAERERYLKESERIRRAAEQVWQRRPL